MDTDTRRVWTGILWGLLFGAAMWAGIIWGFLVIYYN